MMSKILKVISNEEIRIEEYKNPRVCFNNTEYDDIENYCVLRETINPFQMFYKNRELQQRIDKAIEYIENKNNGVCIVNGEEKDAYTFLLDFKKSREFVWQLLKILKDDNNE